MKKSSLTLMTEGSVWKRIITFAIPIFWGNLFQQLYNTADSFIVGNFLGSSALAAVSSSGNLISFFVGFFNGMAIGAGVIVAKYFGAKNYEKLKKAIHTTVAFGLICGVLLTLVGFFSTPAILRLMGTPPEVLPKSITYFRIYFLGSLAFVMYNFFVGILQSLGDSKNPLIYLIISSLLNIVLDTLFIGIFHLDVGAAAFATIISQCLSALLCMNKLIRNPAEIRLYINKIKIDPQLLKNIITYGIPAGLQNSIVAFSNIFIQSNINSFGEMAMAGFGTYVKIKGFVFLPVSSFALALTTFTGQNLGAKKYDRAKKGVVFGVVCSIVMSELIGLCIYVFIPYFMRAFSRVPEVIRFGADAAHIEALFYFLMAFSHCMAGILRGAGKSKVPMYVMLFCWCVVRVSYISIILKFIHNINVIFWAYPMTWLLSSIVFFIYYKKSDWIHGLE